MTRNFFWNLSFGCVAVCIVMLLLLWGVTVKEFIGSGQIPALADLTVTTYLPHVLIAAAVGLFIFGARNSHIASLSKTAMIPAVMLAIGLVFSASIIYWIVTSLQNGYNLLEASAGLIGYISLLGLLMWMLSLGSKKIAGTVGSLTLAGFIICAGCFGFLLGKNVFMSSLTAEKLLFYSAMLLRNVAVAITLWTYMILKDRREQPIP